MQPDPGRQTLKNPEISTFPSEMLVDLAFFCWYYPDVLCPNNSYGPIETYSKSVGPADTPNGLEQTGI